MRLADVQEPRPAGDGQHADQEGSRPGAFQRGERPAHADAGPAQARRRRGGGRQPDPAHQALAGDDGLEHEGRAGRLLRLAAAAPAAQPRQRARHDRARRPERAAGLRRQGQGGPLRAT